jgi:hypothetical protein
MGLACAQAAWGRRTIHGGPLAKSFDLKSYARRGAEVRLGELREEMNAIYGAFPDLRQGKQASNGAVESSPAPRRRRRRMSAAQRKAVGERMRKYWAKRRKAMK